MCVSAGTFAPTQAIAFARKIHPGAAPDVEHGTDFQRQSQLTDFWANNRIQHHTNAVAMANDIIASTFIRSPRERCLLTLWDDRNSSVLPEGSRRDRDASSNCVPLKRMQGAMLKCARCCRSRLASACHSFLSKTMLKGVAFRACAASLWAVRC